jgi:hypothetical protein
MERVRWLAHLDCSKYDVVIYNRCNSNILDLPQHLKVSHNIILILIIIMINMLMLAPMIDLHIQESYWYSKHRGIGPNLASDADGQSCPSLG